MLIVDVETTGTNPQKHSLLSIGAVDFTNPENQFYEECRMWDAAHVEDTALVINGFTREQISDPRKKTEGELVRVFLEWVKNLPEHTIGGQNPSFDIDFIQAAAARNHIDFTLPHRSIDLHSICCFHMIQRGLVPPVANKRSDLNSDKIMTYVGIPAEPKPHIGINGARYEAEAFHRLFHNEYLFQEFKEFPVPWLIPH